MATTIKSQASMHSEQLHPLLDRIKIENDCILHDEDTVTNSEGVSQITRNELSSPFAATKVENFHHTLNDVRVKDEPDIDETLPKTHTNLEVGLNTGDFIGKKAISEKSPLEALQFEMLQSTLIITDKQTNHSIGVKEEESCKMSLQNHIEVTQELVPFLWTDAYNIKKDEALMQEAEKETQVSYTVCQDEGQKYFNFIPSNLQNNEPANVKAEILCNQKPVWKQVSDVCPCAGGMLFPNVSVRLVDIFLGNTDRFGKGHSNIGSCSCIFCQGKFNMADMPFLPKVSQCSIGNVTNPNLQSENVNVKMLQQKSKLNVQVKVEHLVACQADAKPLICDICSAIFKRTCDLQKHKKQHFETDKKPYKCKECGKAFHLKTTFKNHLIMHSSDRPFKCILCPKTYKHKGDLTGHMRSHLRVHPNERPYKCKECGKAFHQKAALKNHLIMHSSDRPFQCTLCPKTYKHKGDLTGHMRLHTGDKVFKCNLCPRMFDAKSKLETHLRVHSNERPFSCTLCPATFKQPGQLPVHMRCVHRNERIFNCSQCFVPFKQRSTLNAHMRYAHTVEQPFKCNQCPSKFKDKRYLKRHMFLHIQDKPWECDICKRRFKTRDRLYYHVILHTSDRPFHCEHCSLTFKNKLGLRCHLIIHRNAEGKFQCEHCCAKFKSKREVRTHLLIHM